MVLIVVLASVNSLAQGSDVVVTAIALLALTLVLLECRRVPRSIWLSVCALLAVSFLLLFVIDEPSRALVKGLSIGSIFAALVASVSMLGKSALRTQAATQISGFLDKANVRNQYFTYSATSQLFSGMLNLAGTNVLFAMAASKCRTGSPVNRSTFGAIARGFSAATFWSPMFGNMSVMLALYPSLAWGDVLWLGFVLAQVTLLTGMVLYRVSLRHAVSDVARTVPRTRLQLDVLFRLLAVLTVYIACLFLVSDGLQTSITNAIIFTAPLVSLLINVYVIQGSQKLRRGLQTTLNDAGSLSRLTPEILIFLTAGVVGTVLAQAVPDAWIELVSNTLSGHVWIGLSTLMLAIMIFSLIGLHPILSAVMLASSLTPSAMGLSDIAHFGAILMGWGIAASLTPFSVLNITASHLSGIPLYAISIQENWLFSVVNLILVSSLLAAVDWFVTSAG